jgi:hypothetical protein
LQPFPTLPPPPPPASWLPSFPFVCRVPSVGVREPPLTTFKKCHGERAFSIAIVTPHNFWIFYMALQKKKREREKLRGKERGPFPEHVWNNRDGIVVSDAHHVHSLSPVFFTQKIRHYIWNTFTQNDGFA